MQTFLPFADLASVRFLDPKRGFNQINEALVILKALRGAKAWSRHPATRMWQGYTGGLCRYGREVLAYHGPDHPQRHMFDEDGPLPPWVGQPEFHEAHRAALVRKDPVFYGRFWADPPSDIYVWPLFVEHAWVMRKKKVGAKGYMTCS